MDQCRLGLALHSIKSAIAERPRTRFADHDICGCGARSSSHHRGENEGSNLGRERATDIGHPGSDIVVVVADLHRHFRLVFLDELDQLSEAGLSRRATPRTVYTVRIRVVANLEEGLRLSRRSERSGDIERAFDVTSWCIILMLPLITVLPDEYPARTGPH
jgi:hypothetical protein